MRLSWKPTRSSACATTPPKSCRKLRKFWPTEQQLLWKRRIRHPGKEPAGKLTGDGEPGRNRTCDPRIKSALLYQLSYGPHTFNLPHGKRRNDVPRTRAVSSLAQVCNPMGRRFASCLPTDCSDGRLVS